MRDTARRQPKWRRTVRMRNWRVRWKLVAVVLVPTIATVGLAGTQIADSVAANRSYDRVVTLARLGDEVTQLVHELQKERDLAAGYVGSAREFGKEAMEAQQATVDQAQPEYLAAADRIDDSYGDRVRELLDVAQAELLGLNELRQFIGKVSLTRQPIFSQYTGIIRSLLDVNAAIATEGDSAELSSAARVLADFSAAKEYTSQVRGKLFAILRSGAFAVGELEDFLGPVQRANQAIEQFRADADTADDTLYANTVRGKEVSLSQTLLDDTIQQASGFTLAVEPDNWYAAQTERIELMRDVETELLSNARAISLDLRSQSQRDAIIAGVVLLGVLLLAAVATYFVARSMTRPLRLLRTSALEVADRRLPEVIERLRRPDAGNLGDIRVEPTGIDTRDEIGEVARAFDAVHREAVRLASDQAQLRQSVNAMFVNLPRQPVSGRPR